MRGTAAIGNVRLAFFLLSLWVAAIISGHIVIMQHDNAWALDFNVFYRAAVAQAADVYRPAAMPFVNPPPALLLFKPLTIFAAPIAHLMWVTVSLLLLLIFSVKLAGKAAVFVLLSPAVVMGAILGQSTLMLGAWMIGAMLLSPFFAGVVLGVVAAVKPQLLILAPLVMIVRKDWQMLGGMALGGLAMIAMSLSLGPRLWLTWLTTLPDFVELIRHHRLLTAVITPAGKAEYLGLPPLPFLIAGTTLAVASILFVARRVERETLLALMVGASLVSSPYAHVHDTVAMMPACISALLRGPGRMWIPAALIFSGFYPLVPAGLVFWLLLVPVPVRHKLGVQESSSNPSDGQSLAQGVRPSVTAYRG